MLLECITNTHQLVTKKDPTHRGGALTKIQKEHLLSTQLISEITLVKLFIVHFFLSKSLFDLPYASSQNKFPLNLQQWLLLK